MQPRGTGAIPLPPRASLEQYHNRAKGLLRACKSGDGAVVRAWARQWLEALVALTDSATTDVSPKTADRIRRLHRKEIDREVDEIERDARESGLLSDDTSSSCSLADAQLFIARLHDFASWPKFSAHIEALARADSPDAEFESAADAVVAGDVATLRSMLQANPGLVSARSARDHAATLLHYIAANGHEGWRQKTPKNAVEVARLLLDAGAAPDALAHMYGGDATTMDMLVSSVHPHAAGVQVALVDTLVDYGAAVNGVEDNGSPLMTALRFHYPLAAEALAKRGARVDNVITAAALGRTDLVDAFVTDSGELRPGVPLAQVRWPRLPRDPKVHLAYALTWAATWGRGEVVELMLRKGVDPGGKDDDATALHFAAAHGHVAIVRLLVQHGASLEALNSYGGTVLSGTLWYMHNAAVPGVDYQAVVRELIALGARVDAFPGLEQYVDEALARG
ncbi:MAG TPA: ankyrin repeat domain-containing protein [Gemmatimonadaceae bacterium]|nr:ankyrin repeat domain-containing protein [Gemmatimonadaceae bacterium]